MNKLVLTTLITVLATMVVGCAPTPRFTKIPTATGHDSYSITCNGNNNSWDSCYEKADIACESNTFTVTSKVRTVIPARAKVPMPRGRTVGGVYVAASPYEVLAANIHNANCGPNVNRDMTVVCSKLSEMSASEIANKEVAIFGRNNEFFEIVRFDMADLMDEYAGNGKDLSLQKAYDLAITDNEEVKKIRKENARKAQFTEFMDGKS